MAPVKINKKLERSLSIKKINRQGQGLLIDPKLNSILVVGTVRNVGKNIGKEIKICQKALKDFRSVSFYLVESDSTDKTLIRLDQIKQSVPNFEYISLGNLSKKIPDQYNRIRFCRNKYVSYIRSIKKNKANYILVVDLDGMNKALNSKSIRSCFKRNDWDVVVSNQTFGYYDILALRHPTWQERDWRQDSFLYSHNLNRFRKNFKKDYLRRYLDLDKINYLLVYSKMIRIPKNYPWINVNSGFGGAAIYKNKVFKKFDYSKEFKTIETDHVSLNRKIIRSGGKILLNPRFINSHLNTYNINRYFLIRFVRINLWNNKKVYNSRVYNYMKFIFKR